MATEILEREAISLPEKTGPDDLVDFNGLAVEAEKLLGYNVLAKDILQKKEAEKQSITLRQALSELGIRPFTANSVKSYKDKMDWKCKPLRERICTIVFLTCLVIFISTIICLALCGIVGLVCYFAGYELAYLTTFASVLFIVLWLSFVIGFFSAIGHGSGFVSVSWNQLAIANYGGLIPEFALQTAVDLKKKCPQVNFLIEEMTVRRVVRPDPFLIVELGNETYYLEVWNEPDFKKVREA